MEIKLNSPKEELGQVYTPSNIARLMASFICKEGPKSVLDPAVGEGALIKAVKDINPNIKISGLDIDEDVIDTLKQQGFDVYLKSFFDFSEKIDGVIMNPPYIRQELLVSNENYNLDKKNIRNKLQNSIISSKANLYLYFFEKAINILEDNGTLVCIMPNTWLTSEYGREIQKKILEKKTIIDIIHFEKNVFDGYDVDVSIFVIKNTPPKIDHELSIFDVTKEVERLQAEDINSILKEESGGFGNIFKVKQSEIEVLKWFKYREEICFNYNNLSKLSEQFVISRGVTTNFNELFILDKENKIVKDNLTQFVPILNRASEVTGYALEETKLTKKIFSTLLSKSELSDSLKTYVESYENKVKYEMKPKTLYSKINKQPDSWFNLRIKKSKSVVFNYIIRNDIRFILNQKGTVVKDNFYIMEPKVLIDLYFNLGVLNSSFSEYFIEICGRSYGTGLLKIQKYELDELPFIVKRNIKKNDIEKIEYWFKKLLNLEVSKMEYRDKVDNILAKYYLEKGYTLDDFYKLLDKTIKKRKGENHV